MRRNKLFYGFLAGALMLTSVVGPWPVMAAPQNGNTLADGLVASYAFDDGTLNNSVTENDTASPIVKGLEAYTGDVSYQEGKDGGQAVRLGDYGLKLNKANLGQNFTVSLWLKPDGTFASNQSVLFLGYHSPEKWLSVAGNADGTSQCKIWANGNGYGWKVLDTAQIDAGTWHCLTVTGSAEKMTAYMDGEEVASGASNQPLSGSSQDIYLGVTNWDKEFDGLVDEVKVYSRTLSAGEAYQLYDGSSPEEVLQKKGITVTESMNMFVGRTETIEVNMPAVVKEAGPAISFRSSQPDIASVDEDGNVTALSVGDAKITASVTLGNTTKTAETDIAVEGSLDGRLVAAYSFEGNVDSQQGGDSAKVVKKGLEDYTGDIAYEEGKSGKGIRLGDYGLKLNKTNLGEEYTVSMWLKPDGTFDENQCLAFLGYHNPENWISLSGSKTGTNQCKVWANGGIFGSHTTLFGTTVESGAWQQFTITGSKGKVTAYLNGIKLGTANSNDPLLGANQDIYLGVNNWDRVFNGLIDEVKVYNAALNENEVQNQAKEEFEAKLKDKLAGTVTQESLLGNNENAQEIKYDLTLPAKLDDLKITWESSDKSVIDSKGTVTNPAVAAPVEMKATVSSGILSASQSFPFQIVPLDRRALDELIATAEAIDARYLTEASKNRLEQAIKDAKEANSYSKADAAYERLVKASTDLGYVEEYVDPFALIGEKAPETRKEMKPGDSVQLFTMPERLAEVAEVEFITEDPSLASYEDGKVTAQKTGKTIVTVAVTAQYDNFRMEYSTAVNISDNDSNNPDDGQGGAGNHETGGNGGAGQNQDSSKGNAAGRTNPTKHAAKTGDTNSVAMPAAGIVGMAAIMLIICKKRKKSLE